MRHRLWLFIILLLAAQGQIMRAGETVAVRPHFDSSRPPRPPFVFHRDLKRPRIALVLSGGGARGVSQIGVLRVLERHQIPVDFIAATSMGSLVGGLYASGYSVAEIESLALNTPWDDILSLTEETRRSELFVDQKVAGDRSFLAVRFQGLTPVLPAAVSTGQRLTEFLSERTLQALYHPVPDFDHLKIPFRAMSTDLISGTCIVLKDGSLAEALRASATVPLLFQPIEKDGKELVDGGLISNIPVDVARDGGYDIVIVVNSTSGLRTAEEMTAPWQTADQIMSIMMKVVNERQLAKADIVITPDVGKHLSSDFHGLDTLIRAGEEAAEESMPAVLDLYRRKTAQLRSESDTAQTVMTGVSVAFSGARLPDSLRMRCEREAAGGLMTLREIEEDVDDIYTAGDFRDVAAEIRSDRGATRVTIEATANPALSSVAIEGNYLLDPAPLSDLFSPLLGRPVNADSVRGRLEGILRMYRAAGYSLARIDTVTFADSTGKLTVGINEGFIHALEVQGGARTRDSFVLGEFPLHPGDVFRIDKAKQGITNIVSTTLFEFVYLEVTYAAGKPVITIRLKERPSQLVRFGMRADNERYLQGLVDIRDENFQGSGGDLGLTFAGGERNLETVLEYKARRLFNTYLTFGVGGFFKTVNSHVYEDGPPVEANHWSREIAGEYRDIRYGLNVVFGTQLERLGNATMELLLQNVRISNLDGEQALVDRYTLAVVRLGTLVDTKDRYPFTRSGVGMNLSYEFAFQGFGSQISYNSLKVVYETYTTPAGGRFTFHPRFTMGFGDRTMPFAQEFSLGGRDSFFGVREDDRRGRELLLMNMECRYFLPFKILFESYIRARYDLGTINEVPEEIKFNTLRHGLGLELALDTPLGQAAVGVGESFYFNGSLPSNPVQQGSVLWYFTIGYQF